MKVVEDVYYFLNMNIHYYTGKMSHIINKDIYQYFHVSIKNNFSDIDRALDKVI